MIGGLQIGTHEPRTLTIRPYSARYFNIRPYTSLAFESWLTSAPSLPPSLSLFLSFARWRRYLPDFYRFLSRDRLAESRRLASARWIVSLALEVY
jgi:hypothetical protein